jgi:hypothetical protein
MMGSQIWHKVRQELYDGNCGDDYDAVIGQLTTQRAKVYQDRLRNVSDQVTREKGAGW